MVEYLSGDHIIHRMVSSNNSSENNDSVEKTEEISKPRIFIKKDDLGVVIKLEKSANSAVKLFSKRGSEEHFTLLAEVSDSQYLDTRENTFNAPELREYMAYHVKNNMQLGPTSDIVLIIKK